MNLLRHPVLGAIMALVLVLTGQSMAIARGTPGPSGQIELCTGTGPVMVSVDENGQPVGPPHICPDAAATVFAAHWDGDARAARREARALVVRPADAAPVIAAQTPAPQARGPPVLS